MLARLARGCVRARRWVVLGWLILLAGSAALAVTVGGEVTNDFSVPGTESQRAFELLETRFPERAGDTVDLVFFADAGFDDPRVADRVETATAEVDALESVTQVAGPFGEPGQVAPNGTVAFGVVQLQDRAIEVPSADVDAMKEIAERASGDGLQVELGGRAIQWADRGFESGTSERVGLIAAVAILLLTFGSVVAMGLPILTAFFALGVGLSALALVERFVGIVEFAPTLAAMIGIGVGIDYSLLIITRYRQELHDGHNPEDAIVVAMSTAGRSIVFAGLTVMLSLAGLFLIRLTMIDGMAIATILTVGMAMLAATTLLPAALGFVGRGIDRLRVARLHRDETQHRTTAWFRWSRFVQRRPLIAGLGGLIALLVLAAPALSMRLGSQDSGNDSESLTTRRAYDLLAEGFGPGFNGRLLLVADLGDEDAGALDTLVQEVGSTPGVVGASPPDLNDAGDAAIIIAVPDFAPQDEATDELIATLRNDVIPTSLAGTDVRVDVGGATVVFIDLNTFIGDRLVPFMAAVLALSFLLLMIVFRSVAVPAKAVVVNVLSIGAAFGLIVAVFQWGWLGSLIGVEESFPIPAFVPVMLFAVLFGLSMDYEVFLLSRVREEYLRSGDNGLAVADGLASTARVITAAAAIMVAVFGSFVLNDDPTIKLFGFGLAAAILIDATLVRTVLVPATMELLGERNWWLPAWLERRLPHVGIEAEPQAPAGREVAAISADISDISGDSHREGASRPR